MVIGLRYLEINNIHLCTLKDIIIRTLYPVSFYVVNFAINQSWDEFGRGRALKRILKFS